jgi:hypothetical protein
MKIEISVWMTPTIVLSSESSELQEWEGSGHVVAGEARGKDKAATIDELGKDRLARIGKDKVLASLQLA